MVDGEPIMGSPTSTSGGATPKLQFSKLADFAKHEKLGIA